MKVNNYDENLAGNLTQLNELSKPSTQKTKAKAEWPVIVGLLVLSLIPIVSGAVRLNQMAGGPEIMPVAERFDASPLPVVLHIVSASLYAILGPFQFAANFRRRKPGWHRAIGRLLVLCGLLVGLTGLWMNQFYPQPPGDGELLYILRLIFGLAMVVSIVLGFAVILRGKVNQHRAWMMRGYAIGLGAGTQVLTLLGGAAIIGPLSELGRALLMGAAWVINLAVAEWVIRKRIARPVRTTSAEVSQ